MNEYKINLKQLHEMPDSRFLISIESDKNTEHVVDLTQDYYQRLTRGMITPEELIKRSFKFLLERESNTSILSSFDLFVINNYFPEYEKEIMEDVNN